MKDYYKILGVTIHASEREIKRTYRRLAKELHPDVNKSLNSNLHFALINEAYHTLIDPVERRKYDLQFLNQRNQSPEILHRKPTGKKYGSRNKRYYRYAGFTPKERKVSLFDKVAFSGMLVVGIAFLGFSMIDLMSEVWEIYTKGIVGIISGLIFLTLLIYGWVLYIKK